jgi:uncharacterized protein YpbB
MSNTNQSTANMSIDTEAKRVTLKADLKGLTDAQVRGAEILKAKFSSGADRMRYMLDCVAKVEGGAGASIVTLEHVARVVEAQMELNKATQKVLPVGTGKKAVMVKFEQRSITPKWIMEKTLADRSAGIEGAKAVNKDAAD